MKYPFIAILVGIGACATQEESEPIQSPEVVASVGEATASTFAETLDASGYVVAQNGRSAALAAPAPARVSRIFVTVGSAVREGDPLVEFEQAPFAASARSAESALEVADRAAERAQRLAAAGVLPRKDAELAAADLESARLNAILARRANELSTLRAPITGTITRMNAAIGASVDPSQTLIELADTRALDALLELSPDAASHLRRGQPVALYSSASATGDGFAVGTVAEVAALVESGGVSVRVHISSSTRTLRLSEPIFGRVSVALHRSAVVIPQDALVPDGESYKVFVVDAEGVAHGTAVTTGGRQDGLVWITSGVNAGDHIVTMGAYGVDDGVKIVAKP